MIISSWFLFGKHGRLLIFILFIFLQKTDWLLSFQPTSPFCKKSLNLTELKRDSFILMPPHTSIYRLCMHSFHNAGIHPQILRTARAESIVSAVEIGEGISLLAESSFHLFRQPSLVAVPINGLDKLSIGIACKKNMTLTSSAECFLRFVESHKYISESQQHSDTMHYKGHDPGSCTL